MAFKEVISEPWNVGDRYFFLKRQEDREQPVIVMRNGLFGEETVLVDPALRATGTSTAVSIVAISHDARFLAYSVRQGGTDHSALEILDIERNTVLPDSLPEGFCTGFVFAPDGTGFYYSHRAVRDPRPNYKAAFWHRFGSDRSQDVEVFFAGEGPNLFLGILDSPEAKLLAYAVFSAGKHPTTSIYLHSLEPGAAPRLLLRDIEGCFCRSSHRANCSPTPTSPPRTFGSLVSLSSDPDPTHWRDIVPQSDRRIQQFTVAGDRIFVTRVDRFSTQIEAFGIKDGERKDAPFSPHGTIDLLNPTNRTDSLFYSYTAVAQPPAVYCYSAREEKSYLWQEANVPFDPSVVTVEETSYTSKDGTSIPLFLAARRDLLHSGPLPTFLTGYGGFGSCVTPRFTAFATFLIEQGLLFAVPALRGGSELGERVALSRQARETPEFIQRLHCRCRVAHLRRAVCTLVISQSAAALMPAYSSAPRLRNAPTCSALAICLGPLLDMTRYHLFDFAAGWAEEYGSPEMSRTSTPCSATRPTIVCKTARTIPQSCSFRVMRTRVATQCMPGKWRHAFRQQIVQNIRFCSITNQSGATRRFSRCRPRSTLSQTDSPSSVRNSEFMSGTGGFRDAVYSSVVDTICL